MTVARFAAVVLCGASALCLSIPPAAQAGPSNCTGEGIELQVLGSGGPELLADRAASSYLIRDGGLGRVLVDIGGGSALRFAQAQGRVEDLDLILLTHLHVDHSADLPALVKASYFTQRRRDLPVLGPSGAGDFPATREWMTRLFGPRGAYAYLQDYLPADGAAPAGAYALRPQDVKVPAGEVKPVFEAGNLVVRAAALGHGIVPAVGWRVEIGDRTVVFSGDTHGNDVVLATLARHADLLVAHNAVPEDAVGAARALHMPPSVIGKLAGAAQVRRLLLSHRMRRSLGREPETRRQIAEHYAGPLRFADDLDCYPLSAPWPASKTD